MFLKWIRGILLIIIIAAYNCVFRPSETNQIHEMFLKLAGGDSWGVRPVEKKKIFEMVFEKGGGGGVMMMMMMMKVWIRP